MVVNDYSCVLRYFTDLTLHQKEQIEALGRIYPDLNAQVNVISRKDIQHLYLHHVLHSLAIHKVSTFIPDQRVLDLGTGGGFPGIPLAIVNPLAHFVLIDGSGKKISIVEKVIEALGLTNVQAFAHRSEAHSGKYHTIVCRAVADTRQILRVTRHLCIDQTNYFLLKGGDLTEELSFLSSRECRIWPIRDFFPEPFFETKQVIEIKR